MNIDLKLNYDPTAEMDQKVQDIIKNRQNHKRYVNEFNSKVYMSIEMQLNSDVNFGKKEAPEDPNAISFGPLANKPLNPKLEFLGDEENMARV